MSRAVLIHSLLVALNALLGLLGGVETRAVTWTKPIGLRGGRNRAADHSEVIIPELLANQLELLAKVS